jgi:hypothetical protein
MSMVVGTTKKVVENKRLYEAVILAIKAIFLIPLMIFPSIWCILPFKAPASFSGSFYLQQDPKN